MLDLDSDQQPLVRRVEVPCGVTASLSGGVRRESFLVSGFLELRPSSCYGPGL